MNAKELENFEVIGKFNYGLAKVKVGEQYTFMNEKKEILPVLFKKAYDFGYADSLKGEITIVQLQNNKWVFINRSAEILTNEYEKISRFKKGIAIAKIGKDKYTYLNSDLKQLGVFKEVNEFQRCGYAIAMLPNEKYVVLDKSGIISKYEFDYVQEFKYSGYATAMLPNKKYVVLDKAGNISKYEYDHVDYVAKDGRSVRMGEFRVNFDSDENVLYFEKEEPNHINHNQKQNKFEKNPHLVGTADCFEFLDEVKLNKIKERVHNEVYRAINAPYKLLPFMGNDEYANLLMNNLETVILAKQKEAKKKLVKAYYDAKMLDAKKDYEKSVGKIIYQMMNDELLNEK